MFEAVLMNCTKHYACEAENGDRMKTMIEMAKVVAGGSDELKQRPIFSMRYGTAVVGVPEMAMMSSAAADLANYYGLPSYVAGG